jgi:hypothetical protein
MSPWVTSLKLQVAAAPVVELQADAPGDPLYWLWPIP